MASFGVYSDVGQNTDFINAPKLKVVTTFSVLADLVQQIGGQYVEVNTLVDWDEDAHVFHPSPKDIKHLSRADLLLINGLGFEGWIERLVSSSKFKGQLVVATSGVEVITHVEGGSHEHGGDHGHGHDSEQGLDTDPHAWQSLSAVKVYVENILNTLIELDSNRKKHYQDNAVQYLEKLNTLGIETKTKMAKLSDAQRHIVIPHNAFAYLARDYDLHIYSLKGLSSEAEASAAQIAQVIRKIKAENIQAVFSETTADKRLIRLVQQETDALMGGALISGALSRNLAPTYLDMMRYNIETIITALSEGKR